MSAAVKLHPRSSDDWYVEPEECTTLLLQHEDFGAVVHDPACGSGNVCRAVIASGRQAIGTDIVRRAADKDSAWWGGISDFLTGEPPSNVSRASGIITNPPFFRAVGTESFIQRALSLQPVKLAVFADVKFLASQRRARGLFRDHCPHRVWIHAKRPSCPPGEHLAAGHEAKGGTADWCWLVWDCYEPKVDMALTGWLREVRS